MNRFLRSHMALLLAMVLALASLQLTVHAAKVAHVDPSLQAWLQIGGTLAELCEDGVTEHAHHDCPFCRELEPVALPESVRVATAAITANETVWSALGTTLHPTRAPPSPPARAPPADQTQHQL